MAQQRATEAKDYTGEKMGQAQQSAGETWEATKEKATGARDTAGQKMEESRDWAARKGDDAKGAAQETGDRVGPSLALPPCCRARFIHAAPLDMPGPLGSRRGPRPHPGGCPGGQGGRWLLAHPRISPDACT